MIEHMYYKKNGSKRIYMHMHRSLFSAGRFPRPQQRMLMLFMLEKRRALRCAGGPHCPRELWKVSRGGHATFQSLQNTQVRRLRTSITKVQMVKKTKSGSTVLAVRLWITFKSAATNFQLDDPQAVLSTGGPKSGV